MSSKDLELVISAEQDDGEIRRVIGSREPHQHLRSGSMGAPNLLKRASSLRQPSRSSLAATSGVKSSLRDASTTMNPPRLQKDAPRSRPVSMVVSSTLRPPETTTKDVQRQTSRSRDLRIPSKPLHTRSQTLNGPVAPISDLGSLDIKVKSDVRKVSNDSSSGLGSQDSAQEQTYSKLTRVTGHKSQFSTYQQQFTPKKPSKTPAPSFGRKVGQSNSSTAVPTDVPAPVDDKAEIISPYHSRLRDELLQLQLIHDSSHTKLHGYRLDAKQKLRSKFEALQKDDRILTVQEQARSASHCQLALRDWISQGNLTSSEKIQILSRCIQAVSDLTSPQGKLTLALEQFDAWFDTMTLVLETRSNDTTAVDETNLFVQPLDVEWHDVVATISRRLDGFANEIEVLGPAQEGSSLATVLQGHKVLVETLRQELECASRVEQTALQRERAWVDEQIAGILREKTLPPKSEQASDSTTGIWNLTT